MSAVRVEGSIEIARAVEDVFAFIANPENLPEWVGPVVEVSSQARGPLNPGDRFTIVQKFLGRKLTSPCEVIDCEPNRKYGYRTTGGPVPLTFTHLLEPSAAGTRLTYTAEGEPGTFFSLAGALFERAANRQLRNDLETLKDVAETKVD
jgi:carbon monoxide dehydrogenase subunit G